MDEILDMKGTEFPVSIRDCIIGHLQFGTYFNDATLYVPWLRDPFNTKIDPAEDVEKLTELKVSNAMKLAFKNKEDIFNF